jgi:hypothetical protein
MNTLIHGYERDDIGRIAREAIVDVDMILTSGMRADEKLVALDRIYMAADHTRRIAIREIAFMRLCGLR